MEIWKTMDSPYEKYAISNNGNIKNINTGYNFNLNNKELGYIRISLTNGRKNNKGFLVHRIVAKYFLDNYTDECIVHHKDGNKLNNNISNLECMTICENNNNKIFTNYGKNFRKISQYDIYGNLIKIWNRCKDIDEVSKKGIYDALKIGKLYKGYYWKYYEYNIKNEKWKILKIDNIDIEISSYGRIKLNSGKITYGTKSIQGYYSVCFRKTKSYRVHRLVCMVFKPLNDYDNLYVNHIDENKDNNHIDNLEWVCPSDNVKKYYELNSNKIRNIRRRNVIRIDINDNEIEYKSLEEAALMNNIKNKGNIVLVCQNKRHTANGYRWMYKD